MARRIVAGRTAPFDLMKVDSGGQSDYCLTIVGWTDVADINCVAERLRNLGPPRYAIAALGRILCPRWRKATLSIDGQATLRVFC